MVAFGTALIGAVIAARLRQSVILGYIVAGMAIGPFTPGPVGDAASVEALADVGIVLLMFAIGVQLSLRELKAAGPLAVGGGLLEIAAVIALGYGAGALLGWQPTESLFLGCVCAISSSAVLTKILGEHGDLDTPYGRITLAWGAVQDLATVLLMVLLGAVSAQGPNAGLDIFIAIAKAVVFLVVAVPLGALVLPGLFDRVAALRNREVFLLSVAAVALGTAYLSTFFGLSLALGAFIAGVVVSESDLSHQILGEIAPLRDLFAGLFFVSVGMLVDPVFVAQSLPQVLLVLGVIVMLKGLIISGIVAASRHALRTAVLSGVLMAQAGEFSFLLARFGVELGAVSAPAFSVMLAAAVASIVLCPLLDAGARPLVDRLERRTRARAAGRAVEGVGALHGLRGHAVLAGFGRVGRVVGIALLRRRFRVLVIEEDRRTFNELRRRGVPALLGNAANPVLLERANLREARLLVVAFPDPFAARLIVDYARGINRRLDIVVRTHTEEQTAFMRARHVSEVVMGEHELALEITRHALHRFGVAASEAQATVIGLRERLSEGDPLDDWTEEG